MNKKIGKIFIIIGCIFLILAIALFLYNLFLIKWTEKNNIELLKNLNIEIQINKDFQDEESPQITEIEINGNKYIGIIDIPILNISLPIIKEIDDKKLSIAPCVYFFDDNQMIIAAHNYPKYFGNLKYLKSGEQILFTDINGNIYKYCVEIIENIESNDVNKMVSSNYDLTLFTCNNTRTKRITVRCNLVL